MKIKDRNKPTIEELEKVLASKDKLKIQLNPDGSISAVPPWYRRKFEYHHNFTIGFKLEDFWIGAFWRNTGHSTDLWICLIPCFPIHLSWAFHDRNQ